MTATAEVIELFDRYKKPVRKWLRDLAVSNSEIDDLAQEVFIRLWKYDSREALDNPCGYIHTVTRNVANDWRERARNRYAHSAEWLEDLEQLIPDEQCFRNLNQLEINDYVNSLLDELPPRRREVLKMSVYEGKTYKQIAIERGLTYRTVLRELTKAYSQLRNRVMTDGVVR